MSGAHRMSASTQAHTLASLRRHIALIGEAPAMRVHWARAYLELYATAGRLTRLWSHLITWELDHVDRTTVSGAIEAAVNQSRRDYHAERWLYGDQQEGRPEDEHG